MNEQEMAKALEGQFFWEKTSRYEPNVSHLSLVIRREQQKYRPKEKAVYKPSPKEALEEIMPRVLVLKKAVAESFGVEVADLESRSTSKYSGTPKNFLMWCACRYFTQVSLNRLGPCFGRHYSTLIHGRDVFEPDVPFHEERIRKIDEIMGFR